MGGRWLGLPATVVSSLNISSTWTVNSGQDIHRAINWGVEGIITNYPQVLRNSH